MSKQLRINDQIRISPIRVIDSQNNQLGIISTDDALNMAREEGLDLVEVSPMEKPPVCRIMDYGKAKYDAKKRKKQAQQGHQISLKEIRLRPKTDVHDREIKLKRAIRFIDEGHKVQFTMLFRGRERLHRDSAMDAFNEIIEEFGDQVKVERPPRMDGRRMTMVLAPGKPISKPKPKPEPSKSVPKDTAGASKATKTEPPAGTAPSDSPERQQVS